MVLVLVVILIVMMVVAGALRVVALVVIIVVMMMVMMLMLVLILVVVMVMMVLMLILVLIVVMVVAGAVRVVALIVVIVVIMMMVLVRLFFEFLELHRNGGLLLHGGHQLLAGELVPRGRDEHGVGVVVADELDALVELLLRNILRAREDDRVGGFDLVIVEFAEVLHIHLALRRVGHGHKVSERHIVGCDLAHRANHVRELADAGRLDQDAVGRVLGDDLLECSSEIAHERAADAAGVHLGDIDARLLQKASVNADLAELVLDQDELLAVVGFLNHLLDERRLARAEKTGVNINFCHTKTPSVLFFTVVKYSTSVKRYQADFSAGFQIPAKSD